jgi:hypothetical protein
MQGCIQLLELYRWFVTQPSYYGVLLLIREQLHREGEIQSDDRRSSRVNAPAPTAFSVVLSTSCFRNSRGERLTRAPVGGRALL